MKFLAFTLILGVVIGGLIIRDRIRFHRLACARSGQSICQFARSFKRREVEPVIIRTCWEAFQQQAPVQNFPVYASDPIGRLYGLESDDLDDLVKEIAAKLGRSLKNTMANPFYSKVSSVGDLVLFLNAQPKLLLGGAPNSPDSVFTALK